MARSRETAQEWFRSIHRCNGYCRDGQHAQVVAVNKDDMDEHTLDDYFLAAADLWGIRVVDFAPAPEFDMRGYGERCYRHGTQSYEEHAVAQGEAYLLVYTRN